jgi:hypothetical protein
LPVEEREIWNSIPLVQVDMQVHDTRIIGWGSQVLDALIKMPKSKVLKIFPMKVMDLNRNSQLQISTRVRL